ncbi:26S proteasome non-ATPase regulatory subunit 5-like [Epargyreus clarus]|uniref:26S proteasome non-ATPase regulatory subunit 5-like n=1 Tax=Epargyreus clarus TaxID=520877 RepID=UPI003C2CCB21
MSFHMHIEKKKAQDQMRRLMAERKNKDKKPVQINNPLAKYNSSGQLTCVLCSSVVRSENVWQVHINSKQHRTNVEQAKKLKELTNNFTDGKVKIKRPSDSAGDVPPEKKLKGILKNSQEPSKSEQSVKIVSPVNNTSEDESMKVLQDPEDDSVQENSQNSKEEDKAQVVAEPPIPEGFFDDPILDAKVRNIEYKDPVEEEWERFQKEIKEEATTSAEIIAGEQEEATAERQIDEIDEQIRNWSRVLDLELKKEETKKKTQEVYRMRQEQNRDSEDEDDIDEYLDWRSKKSGQTNLACEVLKICFEKFNTGEVIKNYTSHIMFLLRHNNSCVRKLGIHEVYKTVKDDISLLPVSEYIDVFVAVAQLVCDDDIGIANKAVLITSKLPQEAYPKVLEEMKFALQCNKSTRCNVYEVIINISAISFDLFQLCVNEGYIDHMVSELESDDVLFQMNILELLAQLAVTPHGINYFVRSGVLQKITDLLASLQDSPLRGLLTPGYMKFFGRIAHNYPKEILDKYPVLTDSLFVAIETTDAALLPVALETLGFIGSTAEGKLCLAALGGKYIQTLEKLGQIEKNCSTEIKVRVLQAFTNLVGVDKDSKFSNKNPDFQRINLMTREWFRCFSKAPGPMEKLFSLCKSPFPEIKTAATDLLDAVCQHTWGQELVAHVAGFVEYLMDRTAEDSKEVKEAKYNIIKRLSTSPAFDANIIERLQTYVEQGPFFSETQLQVALEEDN